MADQKWVLENKTVTLEFDAATGIMRSMQFKDKDVDLFQQERMGIPSYHGALRVYDELDEVWYEDLRSQFELSEISVKADTITYTRQYQDAPFALKVTLTLDDAGLSWGVDAEKNDSSAADRSLRIHFMTPLIAGWKIWAPCADGERVFDGMTPFEHDYLQISYVSRSEVILPMFSHFDRSQDVGYSIVEPIDAKVPAAKFAFNNTEKGFTWRHDARPYMVPSLETVNYMIGLVGDRSMHTEIKMLFHEGCWRPALGQVFETWKPFFVPKNPRMYAMEGMFNGGNSQWDKNDPDKVAATGCTYFEIHGHFSYYGDYFYDGQEEWLGLRAYEMLFHKHKRQKDAWEIRKLTQTMSDQEILAMVTDTDPADYTAEEAHKKIYNTKDHCRSYTKRLKELGVNGFWYFNYTDGFRPEMEEKWESSICKNEDGSYQPSGWYMCRNMNSDPEYPFGRFMIESAKKIIKEYPDLDGFFLDCFRHFEIDFAHDDGITVANNKAAYSVNFSYDKIEEIIENMLLENDMCTFANKPQTIRQMRWVDGMMIEGDGDMAEMKYFWSCLAKPIIYLWTSNRNSDENNCRRAVLYGCYPQVGHGMEEAGYATRKLFMPLYDQFRQRVFCFEKDPLRVPLGCRGELYTLGDDYIAGIANVDIDDNIKVAYEKTPHAMFRVKRGHDVSRVGIMTPGDTEFRYVDFKFNGTMIAVPLKGFTTAAVVKLFVTENTGKEIGDEIFTGAVDSCGDPDSSFTDLSTL